MSRSLFAYLVLYRPACTENFTNYNIESGGEKSNKSNIWKKHFLLLKITTWQFACNFVFQLFKPLRCKISSAHWLNIFSYHCYKNAQPHLHFNNLSHYIRIHSSTCVHNIPIVNNKSQLNNWKSVKKSNWTSRHIIFLLWLLYPPIILNNWLALSCNLSGLYVSFYIFLSEVNVCWHFRYFMPGFYVRIQRKIVWNFCLHSIHP